MSEHHLKAFNYSQVAFEYISHAKCFHSQDKVFCYFRLSEATR